MAQQHERGLGNWQAELAEWPSLFLSAHGALAALNDAIGGLTVQTGRMRANIDALGGLVFAESAAAYLGAFIGRPAAHALVEQLSQRVTGGGLHLAEMAPDAIALDPRLHDRVDDAAWRGLFDPVHATAHAAALCRAQLNDLGEEVQT